MRAEWKQGRWQGDFCTYDAMMVHAKKDQHPAHWRPRLAVDSRDDYWKVLGGLGAVVNRADSRYATDADEAAG